MKLEVEEKDYIEVFKHLNSNYININFDNNDYLEQLYTNCSNVYSYREEDVPVTKSIDDSSKRTLTGEIFSKYYYEEFKKILNSNKFNTDNLDNYIYDVKINYHNVYGKKRCFYEIDNDFSYYNALDNYLTIPITITDDSIIYRELLRMNSTYDSLCCKKISGISYMDSNNRVGFCLNEGYTDLLAIRYFQGDYNLSRFKLELEIVYILEEILGKDMMESCYMEGNVDEFVNQLSNYQPKSNVINFMREVDLLNHYNNNYKKTSDLKTINNLLRCNIFSFLSCCDYKKNKKEYEKNKNNFFKKNYEENILYTDHYHFCIGYDNLFTYEKISKLNAKDEEVSKKLKKK